MLSQTALKEEYDCGRERGEFEGGDKRTINYEAYSQMSKAEWAVYRQGAMSHSREDYSNFERTFDPEKDEEQNWKNNEQWNRAFRSIKREEVEEENQFREKLFRKYKSDMETHKQAREQYYERLFARFGDRL